MRIKAKEQIKMLLAQKGMTQKELAKKLSKLTNKTYTSNSLSHKILRGSISYNEVLLIAEILGFNIQFINNEKELD